MPSMRMPATIAWRLRSEGLQLHSDGLDFIGLAATANVRSVAYQTTITP